MKIFAWTQETIDENYKKDLFRFLTYAQIKWGLEDS